MLGMSPTRGKRAKLVIPCLSPNQACLCEAMNQKDRALCNKVDFMLGMSPNLGNRSDYRKTITQIDYIW
jgi:DTW domain-containing protein YfiP